MKTLDRYLCATFLLSLAGVLFVIFLVVVIAEVRDVYGDILNKDPDFKWILVYLGLVVPGRLAEALPLATAAAVLICLIRLARQRELLAFFCAGLSPARLSVPFLVVGMVLSGALLVSNEFLLRRTEEAANYVLNAFIKNKGTSFLSSRSARVFQKGSGRRFYSMDRFIRGSQEMIRPTIVDLYSKSSIPEWRIEALRAVQRTSESGDVWRFYDAYVWNYDAKGQPIAMKRHDQIDLGLERDLETFLSQTSKPAEMSFLSLLEYTRAKRARGVKVPDLLTELHLKLAFPLAPFVVTLLMCSFTLNPQAGRMVIQFGGGVALIVAFYAVTLLFRKMGHGSVMPAPLAAWLPTLIFFVLGAQWFLRQCHFKWRFLPSLQSR